MDDEEYQRKNHEWAHGDPCCCFCPECHKDGQCICPGCHGLPDCAGSLQDAKPKKKRKGRKK